MRIQLLLSSSNIIIRPGADGKTGGENHKFLCDCFDFKNSNLIEFLYQDDDDDNNDTKI